MALSDTKLRSIHGKPYQGKSEITDIDGLSVRVSPKGVITFQCRYRLDDKQHRIGIGRYPAISLRDARVKAAELKILVEQGADPRKLNDSTKRKITTLDDCIKYWTDTYVYTQLRPKTQALYDAMVIKNLSGKFPDTDIKEITSREWIDLFTDFEKESPKKAHRLFIQLKSAINWCIRRQLIDSCQIMKINPRDIGERSSVGNRVLSYQELAKIWLAIERSRASTSNKLLHQMVMLWGCRLSELRLATIQEFDLESDVWSVPSGHSKTNTIIRRPIFDGIRPLLDKALITYKDILFPGHNIHEPISIAAANKYVRRIRDGMDIDEWRAHDFRRSLATRLSEEGVAPHVIEKMLGHELGGVMAIYNKHDWINNQRDAYDIYFDKLMWHIRRVTD
ncbi:site-specific integrase [Xenorhabdus bovienii]|uniref:tyrosine-type recombinase/integrase n=1 Tax=Xenorhabdus bovienii TaxID=40576 RepID=UPI0023B2242D|nr:site-specific integrase [Xenorhabdus bovienii]MDE9516802.1 site-specific integrase [Xenorhabdus bovienii]MDE9537875.1 site-specific integrase [Xenorhabdus bovienii]